MARITTLQDRVTMDQMSRQGYAASQIASEVGWAIPTVRKWRRRARRDGRKGLASKMGRPAIGALSSYPVRLRETLHAWRVAHPGWGPKTLRAELEADERFEGQRLPPLSGIANFLKEQDLPRPYERHSELPQPTSQVASVPHEEWEMDSRGQERVPDIGIVALVNLCDEFSKAKIRSYPCVVASNGPRAVLGLRITNWCCVCLSPNGDCPTESPSTTTVSSTTILANPLFPRAFTRGCWPWVLTWPLGDLADRRTRQRWNAVTKPGPGKLWRDRPSLNGTDCTLTSSNVAIS